jgi:hypothetical protein
MLTIAHKTFSKKEKVNALHIKKMHREETVGKAIKSP